MINGKNHKQPETETQTENLETTTALEIDEPVSVHNGVLEKSKYEPSRWLLSVIESILFAVGDVVSLKDMLEVLMEIDSALTIQRLRKAVEQLRVGLRENGRGVRIVEVAGGYQMRTATESSVYIRKLLAKKPPRMTRATLETLSIVAYRQPVTRGEVEDIRGVDCGAVLRHLLEKKLVKILGRKEEPGRPLLYGSTKEFLTCFSLKDLNSLPTLKDFAELSDEHRASLGLQPDRKTDSEPEEIDDRQQFQVEVTDAYSPVGDDEVVQELAEALNRVKKQDRQLKETLLESDEHNQGVDETEAESTTSSGHPTPSNENGQDDQGLEDQDPGSSRGEAGD